MVLLQSTSKGKGKIFKFGSRATWMDLKCHMLQVCLGTSLLSTGHESFGRDVYFSEINIVYSVFLTY